MGAARQPLLAGGPRFLDCGCAAGHTFGSSSLGGSEICARTIALCAIERVLAISALAEEDIRLHLQLRLDRFVPPPAGRPRRRNEQPTTINEANPPRNEAAFPPRAFRRTG